MNFPAEAPIGTSADVPDHAVTMRGIVKYYGRLPALDGVDFDLRRGEVHALLGENGAGKSTLMKVLCGLTRCQQGEIRRAGRVVSIRSPRDATRLGIGAVHQHFMLVPSFTVLENFALALPASRGGLLDLGAITAKFRQTCSEVGWSLPENAVTANLPVGVQQRLEILKALATGAEVLVLDEPTAVLAPHEVADLFGVIDDMRRRGRAVVLITHKLSEVKRISDRVTVLRHGGLVGTLPTTEVTVEQLAGMMIGEPAATVSQPEAAPATTASAPPLLRIDDLTVHARTGLPKLRGISLSVAGGEILGVAGVDGNGQTELAEALIGLRTPASGVVWLGELSLLPLTPQQRFDVGVAYIPQDRWRDGLVLEFPIRENLALVERRRPPLRHGWRLDLKECTRFADRLMTEFDVRAPSPLTAVHRLSGGNQQKVVVARALHRRPKLLVAVNPTRGLDVAAEHAVHDLLRRQREQGAAVLLISTDLDEVLTLSDRVAVMYEGRIAGIVASDCSRQEIGLLMGGQTAGRGDSSP